MDILNNIDLGKILLPDVPILEIFLRGTITYLALFLMLRVVARRESGGLSVTDLLVVVLIADAAQNAMAGQYNSIADGLLLVATIIFWSYALDWLGYHVPVIQRLLQSPPSPMVKDGKLMHRNMRKELLTRDELMSQLREQGIEDLAKVQAAYMESDGRISVIEKDDKAKDDKSRGTPERASA